MMAQKGVRSCIEKYNHKVVREDGGETIPYIVVVIDELADLMMVSPKEVEEVHRPLGRWRVRRVSFHPCHPEASVDVLTGIIKANFPAPGWPCKVFSKVDSRTILDTNGAESLLGYGDMPSEPRDRAAPASPRVLCLRGGDQTHRGIPEAAGSAAYHHEIFEEKDV